MSHAVILGATSTLARSMCQLLARDGFALTLIGRNSATLDRIQMDLVARHRVATDSMVLDLEQPCDAAGILATAATKLGPITHFFAFPGTIGNGNADDLQNLATVTQVNYTAPAQFIAAAANHMQTHGTGSIVVISSVAGDRGRASNYPYGAAKAALSTFTDGLRHRLHKTIHVMTVKPGFIDSPMTKNMNSPLIASPDKVAELILTAMHKKRGMVYVPFFWWGIMFIIRHLPEPIFKRLPL